MTNDTYNKFPSLTKKQFEYIAEMLGSVIFNVNNRLRDSDIDEMITTAISYLEYTNSKFDIDKFREKVMENM